MKKVISAVLLTFILLSSFTATVFAKEATPDTIEIQEQVLTNSRLGSEMESQIKYDVATVVYKNSVTIDDVTINYRGTISSGYMLISYVLNDGAYPDVIYNYTIGDYIYITSPQEEVYLYKDHAFYSIKDAYDDGLIGDGDLEEISNLMSNLKISEKPTNPIDDSNKTATSVEESTQVSTPDVVANENNSNHAIATGTSNVYLLITVFTLIISFFVFILKCRKI